MATTSEERKIRAALMASDMKELTQKHPKLVEQLMSAGYKVRLCRDSWVYAKAGRVLHEHTAFQKQVITEHKGWKHHYDISCVIIDPCDIFNPADVGVSFVVSYGMGRATMCTLEKAYSHPNIPLEQIEQMFHRVFEATQLLGE
jgi:hypothetical protein